MMIMVCVRAVDAPGRNAVQAETVTGLDQLPACHMT